MSDEESVVPVSPEELEAIDTEPSGPGISDTEKSALPEGALEASDAGEVSVGVKGRAPDGVRYHTGSGKIVWGKPDKTCAGR